MIARAANVGERQETCDERADRLWSELMHELRVVLTVVQLLLAFLLAAAFTPAYGQLDHTDRLLYLVCVLSGAAATAALTAPVALHRLVTGLEVKSETVAWASRLVATGMVLLLVMTVLGILVVLRQITGALPALLLAAALALWWAMCWVLPALLLRRRRARERPGGLGSAATAATRGPRTAWPWRTRRRAGPTVSAAAGVLRGQAARVRPNGAADGRGRAAPRHSPVPGEASR
ncbi:DUF6328 family protein [Streptomyces sp. NPDC051921]|uniref:DUF6328 family protein n=1 Tax=Streptomyces sp. NPDC051921 TaxID=3155806 RepID=UPI003442FBA0